jgi:uncharacterized protein involved in exopolysaccharide biosynthesis
MSDLENLQQRLVSAMDRISAGAASMPEGSGEGANTASLEQALEEERLTNAQLEERLRALKAKHDDDLAALRAELERPAAPAAEGEQAEALARLDMELQRLRAANDQLRHANAALREANQAGVGEPHLINKAMLAELEGMRATRAADVAEVQAILATLDPLLGPHEGENA